MSDALTASAVLLGLGIVLVLIGIIDLCYGANTWSLHLFVGGVFVVASLDIRATATREV